MGSFRRYRAFDPHDLELMEAAYASAWSKFVRREPYRDTLKDSERKMLLRKRLFAILCGVTDSAALTDEALASMPMPPTSEPPDDQERRPE
jgi:hypothetical protein